MSFEERISCVQWNNNDLNHMIERLSDINDMMDEAVENDTYTPKIKELILEKYNCIIHDIRKLQVITCGVCKKTQSISSISIKDTEFLTIKSSWGYFSNHDCEKHEIVLCCDCYDTYLFKGELGKYINVTDYC